MTDILRPDTIRGRWLVPDGSTLRPCRVSALRWSGTGQTPMVWVEVVRRDGARTVMVDSPARWRARARRMRLATPEEAAELDAAADTWRTR